MSRCCASARRASAGRSPTCELCRSPRPRAPGGSTAAARLTGRIAEAVARGEVQRREPARRPAKSALAGPRSGARARREAADAMAAIPARVPGIRRACTYLGVVDVDLYVGDVEGAWRRVREGWRTARRSRPRLPRAVPARLARTFARALRSRSRARATAESAARVAWSVRGCCAAPRQMPRSSRVARSHAAHRARPAIRAAVAQLRGDPKRAAALLERPLGIRGCRHGAHAAAAARAAATVGHRSGRDDADRALLAEVSAIRPRSRACSCPDRGRTRPEWPASAQRPRPRGARFGPTGDGHAPLEMENEPEAAR